MAKPVFEMGWSKDDKLYRESLCNFLMSQGIKYSNEALAEFFEGSITKISKLDLLEERINCWAKDNGYIGAKFLGKPK